MSVMFMTRFGQRPMHVFGFLGSLMFLLGNPLEPPRAGMKNKFIKTELIYTLIALFHNHPFYLYLANILAMGKIQLYTY